MSNQEQIKIAVIGVVGVIAGALITAFGPLIVSNGVSELASDALCLSEQVIDYEECQRFRYLIVDRNDAVAAYWDAADALAVETGRTQSLEAELSVIEREVQSLNQLISELEEENSLLQSQEVNFMDFKLQQLVEFHAAASCYGRSLNFTHPRTATYADCESKETLAENFLDFFEELNLLNNYDVSLPATMNAKSQLISLQNRYGFQESGWYTDQVLGVLIIEYSRL